MRTWEMIKALTENPNLRFKSPLGSVVTTSKTTKQIVWEDEECGEEDPFILFNRATHCDNMHIEWELIQEPVTFMEAVKARSEGKNIKCIYPGFNTRTEQEEIFKAGEAMRENESLTFWMIENGKWYIEGVE